MWGVSRRFQAVPGRSKRLPGRSRGFRTNTVFERKMRCRVLPKLRTLGEAEISCGTMAGGGGVGTVEACL